MILTRPDDVGRLVRQRRSDVGLSQAELAERAGITRQLLSRFEQAKSDLPMAVALRLMRELNLSIDVRTREERSGVIEYRVPMLDPSVLDASLTSVRQALTALQTTTPLMSADTLAAVQSAITSASGSREKTLRALSTMRPRPEGREDGDARP